MFFMAKFCANCGAELSGANFCPQCGKPTQADREAPQSPAAGNDPPLHQQTNIKKRKGCLIPLAVFLFLCVGFVVILTRSGGPSSPSPLPSTSQSPEKLKQDADEFDQSVWENAYKMMQANNTLMDGITAYSGGNMSALTLYNYCDDLIESLRKYKFPTSKNENEKAYVDSCSSFQLFLQITAESLKKYLNDPTTENLSALEKDVENSTQSAGIVASNRGVFLVASGFSEEEIQTKIDAIEGLPEK